MCLLILIFFTTFALMKIRALLTLCCLMSLCLTSCIKNEFRLEFRLDPQVTENYDLSYYTTGKKVGWASEAAAVVSAGKADVKCITRYPTIVYISDPAGSPSVALYAEHGDKITITGSSRVPMEWTIGGNKINEEWSDWRKANAQQLLKNDPTITNTLVQKYIEQNPDKPLAMLLLMTSFDQHADPLLFKKLWNRMGDEPKKGKWVDLFNRPDTPAAPLNIEIKGDGFPLYVNADSIVTFRYADAARSLIWLKQRSNVLSSADYRDLRAAFRDKPDALRRLAIIVCDPDSGSTTRQTVRDSLKFAHIYWLPQAEASQAAASLDVASIPCWVVVDRKGQKLYLGTDLKKAIQNLN